MDTNAKRNEHPRCACPMCRLGAASKRGKETHRYVNRRIRHSMKLVLRTTAPDDVNPVIVSTGYTD